MTGGDAAPRTSVLRHGAQGAPCGLPGSRASLREALRRSLAGAGDAAVSSLNSARRSLRTGGRFFCVYHQGGSISRPSRRSTVPRMKVAGTSKAGLKRRISRRRSVSKSSKGGAGHPDRDRSARARGRAVDAVGGGAGIVGIILPTPARVGVLEGVKHAQDCPFPGANGSGTHFGTFSGLSAPKPAIWR